MQYITITEIDVVIMIVIAGLLGGTINFLLTIEKSDDLNNSEVKPVSREKRVNTLSITWLRCVLIGIGASFLVPLFLATISSSLIKNLLDPARSAGTSADAFVFFGFCLIGAISSRAFIQTLSAKVLKAADEAQIKAQQASNAVAELKSETEPFILQKTEPDDQPSDRLTPSDDEMNLTEDGKTVLKAIIHPKYVLRTKSGISKQSKLEPTLVAEQLNILKKNALVDQIERQNGERWALTARGQKLADEFDLQEK